MELGTVNIAGLDTTNQNLTNIQRSLSSLLTQIATVTVTIGSIPALTIYGNQGPGSLPPVAIGLGSGLTMAGSVLSAPLSGSVTRAWNGGEIVVAATYQIAYTVPFALTISSMDSSVGSVGGSSFTANVQIVHAGVATSVTGLAAVAVNSATKTNTLATASNVASAGDGIQIVITAPAGNPTDAILCLNFSRN